MIVGKSACDRSSLIRLRQKYHEEEITYTVNFEGVSSSELVLGVYFLTDLKLQIILLNYSQVRLMKWVEVEEAVTNMLSPYSFRVFLTIQQAV